MAQMNKEIVITAAVYGVFAVITGAFGAHALKAKLDADQLQVWHTAVQYQFYHTFALLFLSTLNPVNNSLVTWSFYFFSIGVLLFSGSIYLLATRSLLGWDWIKFLGPVTPIGGLLFIGGWITLGLAAVKTR